MKRASFLVSVSLACGLSLVSGCDSKQQTPPDKTAKAGQPAKEAKPHPGPSTDGGAPPTNPHATAQHSMPKAPTLGPPRDVTPSGETREETADGLVMAVPKEWESQDVDGRMRKASFVWPGPGGDVNLLVYRFPGGAGTVDQNIDRWTGQVDVGEGAPAEQIAVEANGLKISGIDVQGKFAGQSMPGVPPTPAYDDARMFAVAIEGSGDPYYLKVVGPAKTVDLWAEAWGTMLAGLKASADAGSAAADPAAPPAPAKP